jgi:hypothetical protein
LNDLAHLVIANDGCLERVGPSGHHIACRNVSNKLRTLGRIDNDVSGRLIDRLIVGPLGQLFTIDISKDEIVFTNII